MIAGPRQTFIVHVHLDDGTAVVEDVREGGSARAGKLADVSSCIGELLTQPASAHGNHEHSGHSGC